MSIDDLVVRLRSVTYGIPHHNSVRTIPVCLEAADTIEKLRALLEEAVNELPDYVDPDDRFDEDGDESLYPPDDSLIGRIQVALGLQPE